MVKTISNIIFVLLGYLAMPAVAASMGDALPMHIINMDKPRPPVASMVGNGVQSSSGDIFYVNIPDVAELSAFHSCATSLDEDNSSAELVESHHKAGVLHAEQHLVTLTPSNVSPACPVRTVVVNLYLKSAISTEVLEDVVDSRELFTGEYCEDGQPSPIKFLAVPAPVAAVAASPA